MAAELWTQQYRPHTLGETATEDALSVGFVRDMANNLNNACRHALAHKRWSEVGVPLNKFITPDAVTAETVIAVFAPRFVPACFNTLTFLMGTQRTAGTAEIVWTVYVHEKLYTGSSTFATSSLSSVYYSDTVTTSADTNVIGIGSVTLTRDTESLVWVVVTGANGDAGTRARMTSFDAWPAG